MISGPLLTEAEGLEEEWRRRQAENIAYVPEVRAPDDFRLWLKEILPHHFNRPLAKRHVQFWKHILAIQPGKPVPPFAAIWPRGGGKTTDAEAACMAVGVRGRRQFAFYVRDTAKRADEAVQNIASMLESPGVAKYYPLHSERELSKFGHSKGWTQSELRTQGGFKVQALGLDTAARGVKIEANRPDFIIFDDIDDTFDTPATTWKKIQTITRSILPAGSPDVAVILIQNLVNEDGLFTQLVDGRAEFLSGTTISGPYPAVEDLQWEWQLDPRTEGKTRRPVITRGTPTWSGQDMAVCQAAIERVGPAAFLREYQHEVKTAQHGLALRTNGRWAVQSDEELRELVALGRCFGGVDFGEYRFAFVFFAVDQHGIVHQVDEYFSQREDLSTRARTIHELVTYYGWPCDMGAEDARMMPIWGDAANPQDIRELNAAFRRGWNLVGAKGQSVLQSSKLRCLGVMQENKARRAAVAKINNGLDNGWLWLRHITGYQWQLGMTASDLGKAMNESRFEWELKHWSFPKGVPGEPQDQNPDDATADGADMIAAARYALMSYWGKAKTPVDYGYVPDDAAMQFDYVRKQFVEAAHALDSVPDMPIQVQAKVRELSRRGIAPAAPRMTPLVNRPRLLGSGGRLTPKG